MKYDTRARDQAADVGERRESKAGVAALAVAFLVFSDPARVSAHYGLRWNATVAALSMIALLLNGRRRQLAWPALIVLAAFLWLCVGVSSSVLPREAMIATISLGFVLLTAMLLGTSLTQAQILRGLAWGIVLCLVLSLLLAAVSPGRGLVTEDYHRGALKGIYEHRNQLGYVAALGVLIFGLRSRAVNPPARLWHPAMSFVSLALVAATYSATALAVSVGALIFLFYQNRSRKSSAPARALLTVVSVAVGVFALSTTTLSSVAGALGRDSTLTNRTEIWPLVIAEWKTSKMGGFGWGAAWADLSDPQRRISEALNDRIYHAHDSYLDLLFQTGIVGLALFLAAVIVTLIRSRENLRAALTAQVPGGVAALEILLIMMLIYSTVETRVSQPLGWFVLMMLAARSAGARTANVAERFAPQELLSSPRK